MPRNKLLSSSSHESDSSTQSNNIPEPPLIFSNYSQSLGQLLQQVSLPRVIKCDGETCPGKDSLKCNVDITQPLLAYQTRKVRKVSALSLVYDSCKNDFITVGNGILIPEDYPGWFAVLGSPNNIARMQQKLSYYTKVSDLATSRCNQFLVGGTAPIVGHVNHQPTKYEGTSYLPYTILPGTVLRKVGVYQEQQPVTKDKKKKKEGQACLQEFLKCHDEQDREIFLNTQENGIFFIVSREGEPGPHQTVQIKKLLQWYKFPVIVKLIYGKVPSTPCVFTALLLLTDSGMSNTLVASTLLYYRNINLEIPLGTSMKFFVAKETPGLHASKAYVNAFKASREIIPRYVKEMKVVFGHSDLKQDRALQEKSEPKKQDSKNATSSLPSKNPQEAVDTFQSNSLPQRSASIMSKTSFLSAMSECLTTIDSDTDFAHAAPATQPQNSQKEPISISTPAPLEKTSSLYWNSWDGAQTSTSRKSQENIHQQLQVTTKQRKSDYMIMNPIQNVSPIVNSNLPANVGLAVNNNSATKASSLPANVGLAVNNNSATKMGSLPANVGLAVNNNSATKMDSLPENVGLTVNNNSATKMGSLPGNVGLAEIKAPKPCRSANSSNFQRETELPPVPPLSDKPPVPERRQPHSFTQNILHDINKNKPDHKELVIIDKNHDIIIVPLKPKVPQTSQTEQDPNYLLLYPDVANGNYINLVSTFSPHSSSILHGLNEESQRNIDADNGYIVPIHVEYREENSYDNNSFDTYHDHSQQHDSGVYNGDLMDNRDVNRYDQIILEQHEDLPTTYKQHAKATSNNNSIIALGQGTADITALVSGAMDIVAKPGNDGVSASKSNTTDAKIKTSSKPSPVSLYMTGPRLPPSRPKPTSPAPLIVNLGQAVLQSLPTPLTFSQADKEMLLRELKKAGIRPTTEMAFQGLQLADLTNLLDKKDEFDDALIALLPTVGKIDLRKIAMCFNKMKLHS